MASKKAGKKAGKKASSKAVPSSELFAKDLAKLFDKHRVSPLTISPELSLNCPPGTHAEMVPIQDANGDINWVRICVKDD
jgi:hypothetical protein